MFSTKMREQIKKEKAWHPGNQEFNTGESQGNFQCDDEGKFQGDRRARNQVGAGRPRIKSIHNFTCQHI